MKKKQLVALLVLLLALAGLVAGYFIYSSYAAKKEAEKEAEEANEIITLHEIDSDSVTEITYRYDGEELTLLKKENGWEIESSGAMANDDDTEGMVGAVSNMAAIRVILDKPDDKALESFGLKDPYLSYTFTLKDGSEYSVKVGAKLVTEDDAYYALVDDKNVAYAIASDYVDPFKKHEIQITQMEDEFDFTKDSIRGFEVESESTSFAATYVGSKKDENTYYTWKIDRPYKDMMADTDSLDELISKVDFLQYKYCVKYQAESYEEYGLEEPNAFIIFRSDDNEVQLEIGNEYTYDETRYYYVRPDYSDNIYLMDAEDLDKLLTFDEFSLVDPCVYSVLVKDVKSFEIICDGKTYKITKKEVPKTKDDDSKSDKKTKSEYYVNGKKVVDEDILTIYSLAYLLTLSGEAEEGKDEGEPVLTFIYHPNKGDDVTVKYNTYDGDNFYRVDKNGINYFLTDKRGVDEIIDSVRDFAKKYNL